MITALYSLSRVSGAELTLIWYLGWCLLYFLLCSLAKDNRTHQCLHRMALGWLIAEVICDGAWFAFYFPSGHYVNHGIGSMYASLLWPVLLLLAGLVVTAINAKRKSSDE